MKAHGWRRALTDRQRERASEKVVDVINMMTSVGVVCEYRESAEISIQLFSVDSNGDPQHLSILMSLAETENLKNQLQERINWVKAATSKS